MEWVWMGIDEGSDRAARLYGVDFAAGSMAGLG